MPIIPPSDGSSHNIGDLKKAICDMLDRCSEQEMSPALISKAVNATQRVRT